MIQVYDGDGIEPGAPRKRPILYYLIAGLVGHRLFHADSQDSRWFLNHKHDGGMKFVTYASTDAARNEVRQQCQDEVDRLWVETVYGS